MTLATILVTVFLTLGPVGDAVQDQAPPASQTQPSSAQNPTSSAQPQNPPAAPKPHIRRKKISTSDCSASSTSKSTDTQSTTTGKAQPCPPKKVVVKDGGSDELTVQLKGDTPTANASDERLNTEQLRLATEDNLKKIAGRQLNSKQQDTVDQIKQFLDQSKAAIADGDLERGHNLAMKARLLSDELVSP